MAVRKIRPSRRSITGHVPSKKKPGLVAFESGLERDAIMLLEFDPLVRTIAEQPVRIFFEDGTYTPDLYVEFLEKTNLKPLLIEIKYRDDLFASWTELHPRLRAGMRYGRNMDWRFVVLTETEIRTLRLSNIKKLWRYRTYAIDLQARERVMSALLPGPKKVEELVNSLGKNGSQNCDLMTTIWCLVATGQLHVDLDSEPITKHSTISAPSVRLCDR